VPRSRPYYGWFIVCVSAAAMVGTLPGRTQGLGLITEPLLADLAIDRVTYAGLNFWATMIGALGAIGIGRAIDRAGSRVVLTIVAIALGAIVCGMSQVAGLITLAVALTATRLVGQSALSVVSIAMVGQWFVHRINVAMAVYSIALSVGFMIAFPIVGSIVQLWGWRRAWLAIGIALLAVLAPMSWLIVRRSPEAIGLAGPEAIGLARPEAIDLAREDETPETSSGSIARAPGGSTWFEALTTSAFWVFAIGSALYGLVASGIGLFNESILAERGFGPDIYYQSLVVTALTALAGNFLGGWLSRTVAVTRLMAAALLILALGLAALPHLSSVSAVLAWAAAMGLGGGLVMVLFFSVWPKIYGRRHLGRIQGIAQALTVFASAIGPLLLAWCIDLTGSYAAMFRILAGVIAAAAAAAAIVDLPPAVSAPLSHPNRARL
jgi:MFS family permease